MAKSVLAILYVAAVAVMVACSPQNPTSEVVEVTRIVEVPVEVTRIVQEEVPVTRIVEREVEVTRIVEVSAEGELDEALAQLLVAPTPQPTVAPDVVGSRQNPVPVGVAYGMEISATGLQFQVTVLDASYGEEAWEIASAVNEDRTFEFNAEPEEGWQYVIANLQIDYNGEDKGILELSRYSFGIVSGGTIYELFDVDYEKHLTGVGEDLDVEMLSGGSATGYLGWQVPVAEEPPTLKLGNVYFSLSE